MRMYQTQKGYEDFEGIKGAMPKKVRVKNKKEVAHYKAASVSESDLQDFMNSECDKKQIDFFRVPDSVLVWIFENPDTPLQTKLDAVKYLKGLPDNIILKPLEGTNYNIALLSELKTDCSHSKLSRKQKERLKGLNYVAPRSKEDVLDQLEMFEEYKF